MSPTYKDHNWSNPETKVMAYYLFDFERETLEEIGDIESFSNFISNDDRDSLIREMESSILTGMVPDFDPEMELEKMLEAFLPGARIKYATGMLKELFYREGFGSTPTLWEAGILIGASFKYKEGERGAPTKEDDPEWEEEISPRNFGLLLEMYLLSLDRVNWEEIVTVWIEQGAGNEEGGEAGSE